MKLEGFSLEFDASGTWGCMWSDKESFGSRWICVDDGGEFGGGSGAGGVVVVKQCARSGGLAPHGFVHDVRRDPQGGRRWATRRPCRHDACPRRDGVVVQLTGPPDQKATMQKLINEIRARA